MTRANRIAVVAVENGLVAKFFRTHAEVRTIYSWETGWKPDEKANSTANRESFRQWACDNAELYDVQWDATKAKQAWDRKHQKYETDEQVAEDATTLLEMALTGVANKMGYSWTITYDGIWAKKNTPDYVIDGKYEKNGCWAWADIAMTVKFIKDDCGTEIPMDMEMVSGQIKKPKVTQGMLMARLVDEENLQAV